MARVQRFHPGRASNRSVYGKPVTVTDLLEIKTLPIGLAQARLGARLKEGSVHASRFHSHSDHLKWWPSGPDETLSY